MDIDMPCPKNIRLKTSGWEKQTMLLFIFLGLFQKRREINECREQIQTTARASGRTWCAAQVVLIDGITACWKVYNVKFAKLLQNYENPMKGERGEWNLHNVKRKSRGILN